MLSNCGLSNTVHCVMCGELNEQMGVGQYWVCFHVDRKYGGNEGYLAKSSKKQH